MLRPRFLLPLLPFLLLTTPTAATFVDNISYASLLPHLTQRPTLLFITVRWCNHCAALSPELAHLARAAASLPRILVARSDADDHPAVAAAFAVRAYPTILYIPPSHHPDHAPTVANEFAGQRWAEIIAEFVNNQTSPDMLPVPPRPAFQKWRKENPFNPATAAPSALHPARQPEPETQNPPEEPPMTLGIREPARFTAPDFDELVFTDAAKRYMVLFYSAQDPLLRELLVQWRQASSAFTGADNVTIALANISLEQNQQLVERFSIATTPRCLFFPRCDAEHKLPGCKQPTVCDDDMDETENIIQFLSDRVLEEMGFKPDEGHRQAGQSYHLTDEEYQRLKRDGAVFANDPDHVEDTRALHEGNARTASGRDASSEERDEL